MILIQHGARIQVRSVPAAESRVVMDLAVNGTVVTGTWSEETSATGYYGGGVYFGAIQMLAEPTGHRLTGKWLGFGRDFDINVGPWTLQLVSATPAGKPWPGTTGRQNRPTPKMTSDYWTAERRDAVRRRHTTHGQANHPLYSVWYSMLQRCENPRNPAYKHYGGRGIAVCERWHDVRLFIEDIERDLGPRPAGMSIDRHPDNNGNYEPSNVRWATTLQQAQNKRPPQTKPDWVWPPSMLAAAANLRATKQRRASTRARRQLEENAEPTTPEPLA